MEALLPDGMSGYVLGPTVLGHTTAGSAIDPRAHFDADLGAASPDSETAEPYLTRLSLLTTVVITLAIVADLVHQPENWGGILQGAVLFALPLIGLFVNSFLGSAADARGEYGAWPVALIGPAVWFLTILVIYLVRGRSFW